MKKVALAIVLALFLTSCGGSAQEVTPTAPKLYVPSDCTKTQILAAFPESIPNPAFIDTQWEPAEGTDLFETYSRGGIACSYGIQTAEIGATILWAPDDEGVFNSRIPEWTKAGQVKTDLPGVEEENAYVLSEGGENSAERHVWAINLLIEGIWIQVNATYLQTIEEAIPLVKAAIDSLVSKESHLADSVSGCFVAEIGKDLLTLDLEQQDRNLVIANIKFLWSEKDANEGQMIGSYTNGVLTGIYDFTSEGGRSQRELFFKGDKTGFVAGFGPVESKDGIEKFKRPLKIKWDENYKYLPSDKCKN
jgi:hypothetical protein